MTARYCRSVFQLKSRFAKTMSVWALNSLQRIIRDLDVYQDGRQLGEDALEAFIGGLELVYRDLIAQQALKLPFSPFEVLISSHVHSTLLDHAHEP